MLVLFAFLLVAPWRPLAAHTRLAASRPAAGSTLREAPRELRLTFSTRAERSITRARLRAADGRLVTLGPIAGVEGDAKTVVFPIAGSLAGGSYTVEWTTGSADGHPVRGSFTFTIALPTAANTTDSIGAGAPPMAADPHAGHGSQDAHAAHAANDAPAAPAPGSPGDTLPAMPDAHHGDGLHPLASALRFFELLALLGLVGAVAYARFVVRPVARLESDVAPLQAPIRIGVLVMLLLYVVATVLRLVSEAQLLLGDEGRSAEGIARVMLETRWGMGWLIGVACAFAVANAILLARGRPRWGVAEVGAITFAFTPGLTGHAASTEGALGFAIAADALHVLGAAVWLGTLGWVVASSLPALREHAAGDRDRIAARAFGALHPVALAGAALVVASGGASAWLRLGDVRALTTTTYGQVLLAKLVLFAGVLALGFRNSQRVTRAGTSAGAGAATVRSARAELLVALVVLVATAFLVAIQPPSMR